MEIIQRLNITKASSRQGGPRNKVPCLGPDNRDLLPLGPESVESPSAVRHVDELMSSRSEPNGLQVERLEAEGQLDNNYYTLRLLNPDYQGHIGAFIGA